MFEVSLGRGNMIGQAGSVKFQKEGCASKGQNSIYNKSAYNIECKSTQINPFIQTSFQGKNATKEIPDAGILKAYYLAKNTYPVAFGRALQDHLSYGATYLGNEITKFKIMAPKATTLHVEVVKKEDISRTTDLRSGKGTEFYWNYNANPTVKSRIIPLNSNNDGNFEVKVNKVKPGDIYRYIIDGKPEKNTIEGIKRKDPNSKSVFDVFGWSEVVDDPKIASKTTHNWIMNDNLASLVIEEMHIGLLGGFKKATERLDKIAERGVSNAIEIMPISEFYKERNWGYDGVDAIAPESSYGRPEEFKGLVDHAHKKGLKVILDVVPNHIGPFGGVLDDYGQCYDRSKKTPWGPALNYEGTGNDYMKRWVVDMSIYWLNMGIDGLRFDMTKFMDSDKTLKLINSEIKNHFPNAVTIVEDGRNSHRVVTPLTAWEIDNPEDGSDKDFERVGSQAQWNFDFQHTLEALLTNSEVMGFGPNLGDLEQELRHGFKWHENPDEATKTTVGDTSVVYHSSHDESGNRGGLRTIARSLISELDLYSRVKWNDWKKANEAVFKLTKAYLTNAKEEVWTEIHDEYNIFKPVTREEFKDAYTQAQSLNRLALGTVFIASGPKMILMGDDEGCLSPFKFFAQYPPTSRDEDGRFISEKVSDEKGYPVGERSFAESRIDQKEYEDTELKNNTIRYSQSLADLLRKNPALTNGLSDWDHMQTYKYEQANVLHVLRKEGNNEILAVMNFGKGEYSKDGYGGFDLRGLPQGEWEEVLNSDNKQFGGNGLGNANQKLVTAENGELNINLPKNSIVIFKKKN